MKLLKGCLMVIGAVVVLGVIAAAMGRGDSTSSQASVSVSTVAPVSEPTAVAYVIGSDVRVDQMRWRILEAADLGSTLKSDNQFIKDLNTAGRFIQVRFEMENLSKDLLSYSGIDLVDDQGRSFKVSSDTIGFIPQEQICIFENLNPNVAKTCTVIYEVPANAAGLRARVTDLQVLGAEEALVDLGIAAK